MDNENNTPDFKGFETNAENDIIKIQINNEKKSYRKYYIASGVCAFILIIAGYIASPLCAPKNIIILGNDTITSEQIIKLCKIDVKKSMYPISLKKAASLAETNPYIQKAEFKRKFPNNLVIYLNMREEIAGVKIGNAFAVIDKNGYVLRMEQDIQKIPKPLITGIDNTEIKIGDLLFKDKNPKFTSALSLILNIQNEGLISDISEINLKNPEDIKMITTQGINVLLGKGENLAHKMAQLEQILIDLHTQGYNQGVVDMRYNGYPVYRRRL